METTSSPSLLLQAERVLPSPVHPHLIACCPTMDLVAVVNQDEQLNVYRFGGQRAFGLQRRNATSNVVSLCWKFNGQYLAVGWSDGIVEVVSAETGNVLQHFRQVTTSNKAAKDGQQESSKDVTCIGWGLNFINVPSIKAKIGAYETEFTNKKESQNPFEQFNTENWDQNRDFASLDDFLERIPDPQRIDIPLDLPEQLAHIDVTTALPKLPALPLLPPAAYKDGDHPAAELFASQASLDVATHANPIRNLNGLETLLLAQSDGTVRLILYDALSIGTVDLPSEWKFENIRFLHHASHPFSCSHMFLTEVPPVTEGEPSRVALIPLSLRFLHSAGSHLHMIESKTAQLETLVQYVGECLLAVHHHWKHAKELPSRFMENVNEMLAEKQEATLVQSLFHLAVTGDCPATLKEWLVDILAERGHKRWDHAISHGYTKVLELTHENLLPALDRCSIILSNLKGFAEYHEHSPVFNVPVSAFDSILNIIRCMRLLAHHVLVYASEESRQFSIFSKWLRHEIDVQASDPASASAEETTERDLGIDYSQLLAYVQGAMEESKLDPFVWMADDPPAVNAHSSMYEDVKKSLRAYKKRDDGNNEVLNLASHFDEWRRHNRDLVDQITSHQRASSSINCGLVLEYGNPAALDMRMVYEDSLPLAQKWNCVTTYTAFVPEEETSRVQIRRIVHSEIFDELKSVRDMTGGIIRFPSGAQVRDVKFVDDEQVILLLKEKETFHLLSLKYRGQHADVDLSTKPHGSTSDSQLPHGKASPYSAETFSPTDPSALASLIKHTFPAEDLFVPRKIEVNGRKNRRFVVVLGEDMRQLKILDLDFKEGDAIEEVGHSGGKKEYGDDEAMME